MKMKDSDFKSFVNGQVVEFFNTNKLAEITVKTSSGCKAKVTIDKDGVIQTEITVKDTIG
jgi:hypothetical protein